MMRVIKQYLLWGVVALMLLGACSEGSERDGVTATVAGPTAVVVGDARATETALLTETVAVAATVTTEEPTTTLVPVTTAVPRLPICDQTFDSRSHPGGALYLRYWSSNQVWLWSELAGEIESYTIPEKDSPFIFSPDGRFIAFSRHDQDDDLFELWIADKDGQNERLLAMASPGDLLERYPNAIRADFLFRWIQTADGTQLAYRFHPYFEALGDVPAEPETVVDIDTGESVILEPLTGVLAAAASPDGLQSAVLLTDSIQLLNTTDGAVLHTIPVNASTRIEQVLTYSFEGKHLVFFAEDGVVLINTADGSSQEIALPYEPVGLGHYSALPGIYWDQTGTHFYTIVTEDEQVFDRNATFSVWNIDLVSGTGTLLDTLNGSFLSAEPSPDRSLLAYWLQDVNDRTLYVADLVNGEQIEYASGELVEFLGWNPNGRSFQYWLPAERKPILGHACQGPLTFADLGFPDIENNIRWVDAVRFLYVDFEATGQADIFQWTIYLNNLDGRSEVIGSGEGSYPQIEFYFDN